MASAAGVSILLLPFALAGIRAPAFPRWLACSGLLLGIVQLTPTSGMVGFVSGLVVLP